MEIDKLEKVQLRDLWKRGERDFTSWLANNLQMLGDELGIKISHVENEKGVGKYSCDILGEDENGDYVAIECQFEGTNHDHLGKIITYLTGLNAKRGIWICGDPAPEHQNAIN